VAEAADRKQINLPVAVHQLHSSVSQAKRDHVRSLLHDTNPARDELTVFVNVHMLEEAVDVPACDAVLLMPTKSPAQILQAAARACRPYNNKPQRPGVLVPANSDDSLENVYEALGNVAEFVALPAKRKPTARSKSGKQVSESASSSTVADPVIETVEKRMAERVQLEKRMAERIQLVGVAESEKGLYWESTNQKDACQPEHAHEDDREQVLMFLRLYGWSETREVLRHLLKHTKLDENQIKGILTAFRQRDAAMQELGADDLQCRIPEMDAEALEKMSSVSWVGNPAMRAAFDEVVLSLGGLKAAKPRFIQKAMADRGFVFFDQRVFGNRKKFLKGKQDKEEGKAKETEKTEKEKEKETEKETEKEKEKATTTRIRWGAPKNRVISAHFDDAVQELGGLSSVRTTPENVLKIMREKGYSHTRISSTNCKLRLLHLRRAAEKEKQD